MTTPSCSRCFKNVEAERDYLVGRLTHLPESAAVIRAEAEYHRMDKLTSNDQINARRLLLEVRRATEREMAAEAAWNKVRDTSQDHVSLEHPTKKSENVKRANEALPEYLAWQTCIAQYYSTNDAYEAAQKKVDDVMNPVRQAYAEAQALESLALRTIHRRLRVLERLVTR